MLDSCYTFIINILIFKALNFLFILEEYQEGRKLAFVKTPIFLVVLSYRTLPSSIFTHNEFPIRGSAKSNCNYRSMNTTYVILINNGISVCLANVDVSMHHELVVLLFKNTF